MSKATAIAPSNIAFVKYWGSTDAELALPVNPSISMTLSTCVSQTTVERIPGSTGCEVLLAGAEGGLAAPPRGFALAVERHLAILAENAGVSGGFRVATRNSFPSAAGIASSASGFAALATAAAAAFGVDRSAAEMSRWARLSGSGSAARSVLGGYVEWPGTATDPESGARVLAAADHWELRDVVAIVDASPKVVSSREGHRRAPTSPYFERRLELLPARLETVRRAIGERDLAMLGESIEAEAIDLHLIAMSSEPPIHYWRPGTLAVLSRMRALRDEGVAVYATMDAGPNVHLICEPRHEETVAAEMAALAEVQSVVRDRVGAGPRLVGDHLIE